MGSSTGKLFCITTFGESHGEAMGVIIDGCPSGIHFDHGLLQSMLAKRRPGQSSLTTQRKESDRYQILSGLFQDVTTGTPITLIFPNQNQNSSDYDHLKNVYRPSHADYTYTQKYSNVDYRGGGRASARETVSRVAAGAVACMFLKQYFRITFLTFVERIGSISMPLDFTDFTEQDIEATPVRCPHQPTANAMIQAIREIRKAGDTLGGIVACFIRNVPVGWGEPVFDKLHAQLGKAILSINAVKGFEYGLGFDFAKFKGSEVNDLYSFQQETIRTLTNFSGGIQGGITNGAEIFFRAAFKPVATLMKPQTTIDKSGKPCILQGKGRHDPCVLPRAVPIVEAMAALTLADFALRHQARKF